MTRVLITGASGFIGRHVVKALLDVGFDVRTLHRGPPLDGAPDHVRTDISSAPLLNVIADVNHVVHLAGLGDVGASAGDPVGYNLVNSVGTLRVLEASRASGASVVLASTQHVYRPTVGRVSERTTPDPANVYGLTKLMAERWCEMYSRIYGVRSTALRFFSVYGPGQHPQGASGVVAIFAGRAMAGQTIEVMSNQRRDFTHVSDVVDSIVVSARHQTPGYSVYNIATGLGTSFEQLARLVRKACGSSSEIDTSRITPSRGHLVPTVELAAQDLGIIAQVKLEDGIRHYCEWAQHAAVRSA